MEPSDTGAVQDEARPSSRPTTFGFPTDRVFQLVCLSHEEQADGSVLQRQWRLEVANASSTTGGGAEEALSGSSSSSSSSSTHRRRHVVLLRPSPPPSGQMGGGPSSGRGKEGAAGDDAEEEAMRRRSSQQPLLLPDVLSVDGPPADALASWYCYYCPGCSHGEAGVVLRNPATGMRLEAEEEEGGRGAGAGRRRRLVGVAEGGGQGGKWVLDEQEGRMLWLPPRQQHQEQQEGGRRTSRGLQMILQQQGEEGAKEAVLEVGWEEEEAGVPVPGGAAVRWRVQQQPAAASLLSPTPGGPVGHADEEATATTTATALPLADHGSSPAFKLVSAASLRCACCCCPPRPSSPGGGVAAVLHLCSRHLSDDCKWQWRLMPAARGPSPVLAETATGRLVGLASDEEEEEPQHRPAPEEEAQQQQGQKRRKRRSGGSRPLRVVQACPPPSSSSSRCVCRWCWVWDPSCLGLVHKATGLLLTCQGHDWDPPLLAAAPILHTTTSSGPARVQDEEVGGDPLLTRLHQAWVPEQALFRSAAAGGEVEEEEEQEEEAEAEAVVSLPSEWVPLCPPTGEAQLLLSHPPEFTHHKGGGRLVLKRYHSHARGKARKELRALRRLGQHPNLVRLIAAITPTATGLAPRGGSRGAGGGLSLLLEYVSGGSLRAVLQREEGQRRREGGLVRVAVVVAGLSSAVLHLHCHMMAHKDLHSENVVVELGPGAEEEEWWRSCVVKLIDLGLCCGLNPLRQALDLRCLGLLVLELATGQRLPGRRWEPCRVLGTDGPPEHDMAMGPLSTDWEPSAAEEVRQVVRRCYGRGQGGSGLTARGLHQWATSTIAAAAAARHGTAGGQGGEPAPAASSEVTGAGNENG